MSNFRGSIAYKITKVTMLMLLLTSFIFAFAIYLVNSRWEDRYEENAINNISSLKNMLLQSQNYDLEAVSRSVVRDRNIKKSIAKSDKGQVAKEILTTFNALSATGSIDVIEIYNINFEPLYSSNGENSFDIKSIASNMGEKPSTYSIERNNDGNPSLVSTYTVFKRGKKLGYIVFDSSLKKLTESYHKVTGADFIVLNKKRKVSIANTTFIESKKNIDYSRLKPGLNVYHLDDSIYTAVLLPAKNILGDHIGYYVSLKDETEVYKSINKNNIILAVSLIFLMLLTVIVLYAYLKKISKRLHVAVSIMQEIARGNLDVKVENTK
jgi:methyl-accepting chemotaxis protein